MSDRLTTLFPLWALILSGIAYLYPGAFTPGAGLIVPLLGVVMFGMGMTLSWRSFAEVARRPGTVALGLALQYSLMPLLAWVIALGLGLPPYLAAGLILVGASPGGTASNLICWLARGDLALSITLTTLSTLLAILATPFLTLLLAGERVPVPAEAMLGTIFKVVLLPVGLGLLVNALAGRRLAPVQHAFPLISVAAILVIIAIVVALNRDNLAVMGWTVAAAVILHNLGGLAAGYGLARLLGRDARTARTLAIEVGMQNSGLAVALAVKHFSAAAALPGAVFSVWHNLSGSALAAWWSRRDSESGVAREDGAR
jgi:bile acid:Na+ symporter, BASS family